MLEDLLQAGRIIAAVVRQTGDDRVAVFEARDHVLQPHVNGIHFERARELVDQALDHERRFRTSGATVRIDRRGVGVHAMHILFDSREVVHARQHEAVKNRGDSRRGRREVGAHVRPDGGAQTEDRAVLARGELDLLHVIAPVRRCLVILAAGFGPLHRTIQRHRAETGDEICRIRRDLAAKPAAYLRCNHTELVFGNTGDDRAQEAKDVRILRRVPQRQLAGCAAPLRQRRSRLHRIGDEPLLDDAFLDDDFCVLERRVDVSAGHRPMKGLVAGHLRVKLRRTRFGRGLSIGHRRERLVIDVDELERVVGLIRGFGDDDRHDIAHIPDDVAAHALVRRDVEVCVRQKPRARHRLQDAADMRARVDQHDTRRFLGAS